MKTGGPAYPQPAVVLNEGRVDYADEMGYGGMTLLDHYAGEALKGLCANPQVIDGLTNGSMTWLATNSWELAEAMIAEREKRMARKGTP